MTCISTNEKSTRGISSSLTFFCHIESISFSLNTDFMTLITGVTPIDFYSTLVDDEIFHMLSVQTDLYDYQRM